MPFTPAISTQLREGKVFAVKGSSLFVVRGERMAVPFGPPPEDALHLGDLDGTACFACSGVAPAGAEPVPLRQLFGALPDDDFAVAGRALGLIAWDTDHRFCGRCGAATQRSVSERVRACTRCGFHSYPRLSPAVIALVEKDGKALLARNSRANMPFFSVLAGFVEVGETLEHAVAREVREEAGIEISQVRYFGSQPWPFTNSLMVGFTARWASGEIVQDASEICDAGWFGANELPPVPPKLSIARELIDDFVRRTRGT